MNYNPSPPAKRQKTAELLTYQERLSEGQAYDRVIHYLDRKLAQKGRINIKSVVNKIVLIKNTISLCDDRNLRLFYQLERLISIDDYNKISLIKIRNFVFIHLRLFIMLPDDVHTHILSFLPRNEYTWKKISEVYSQRHAVLTQWVEESTQSLSTLCIKPQDFNLIRELKVVDLSDYQGTATKDFYCFINPQKFQCNIKLQLKQISKYSQLTFLNLGGQNYSEQEVKHLGPLTNLKTLLLDGAQFDKKGMQSLRGMTNLRNLNLSGNKQIKKKGAAYVSSFCRLRILDISGTFLTNNCLTSLSGLSSLHYIKMSNCNNVISVPESFATLEKIKCLDFSLCGQLDGIVIGFMASNCLNNLSQLKGLRALNLSRTRINDAALQALEGLNIKYLILKLCIHLTDKGMLPLSKMPRLLALDMNRCLQVTATGVTTLSNSESLQSLNVSGCPHVSKINQYGFKQYITNQGL